jgi:mono/diheme cytochrome c family protein
MKKLTKLNFLMVIALAYTVTLSCKKDEAAPVVPKVTYNGDIKAILVANCTPCHMAGGIRANKWDDYATTKTNVSLILDRIQRGVTDVGFMPRGKTTPVPAADIAKIKQWVTDGSLEN